VADKLTGVAVKLHGMNSIRIGRFKLIIANKMEYWI
jgi:hypothetical protein